MRALDDVRRYQLRTSAPWRAALERLRALAPTIAASGLQLDRLDPAARRRIRDLARSVRTIGWGCSTERIREHGLAPEAGDLDGWLRAGIVDAIASRPPGRLDDAPEAHAYRQGHAAALLALYTDTPLWAAPTEERTMTPQQPHEDLPDARVDIDRVIHIPAKLAAALVAAQAAANKLARDEKGDKGKYTSADAIADEARRVLAENGAAWVLVESELAGPGLEQCDIGAQAYVGDIIERWIIVHESGSALCGSSRMPVIASKARPHDKAMSASQTYGHGVALRGALCLVREGKNAIDKREDIDDGQPMRPQQRAATRQPARAAQRDPLARERAELWALVAELSQRDAADPSSVWRWATRTVGLDGLELASLDEESIAEISRLVRGRLEQPTGKRQPTKARASSPDSQPRAGAVEASTPDHARLVAKILGHAELLAGLREATVDEVLRAELRPGAADNLGSLSLAVLTEIEATLANVAREESAS